MANNVGTRLMLGDKTVVAYKPATVTRLKTQGWKVAEQPPSPVRRVRHARRKIEQARRSAPSTTAERPAGTKDQNE